MECQNPKSVHMPRIELSYIRFSKIILLHAFPLGYLSVLCTWPSGMLTFLSAPCTRPCRPKHQISVCFASGLRPDFQNICPFWDPTFEPYVGGPVMAMPSRRVVVPGLHQTVLPPLTSPSFPSQTDGKWSLTGKRWHSGIEWQDYHLTLHHPYPKASLQIKQEWERNALHGKIADAIDRVNEG